MNEATVSGNGVRVRSSFHVPSQLEPQRSPHGSSPRTPIDPYIRWPTQAAGSTISLYFMAPARGD